MVKIVHCLVEFMQPMYPTVGCWAHTGLQSYMILSSYKGFCGHVTHLFVKEGEQK